MARDYCQRRGPVQAAVSLDAPHHCGGALQTDSQVMSRVDGKCNHVQDINKDVHFTKRRGYSALEAFVDVF